MSINIKGGSFTFAKEVDAQDASFGCYFKWLYELNGNEQLNWPYSKENGKNENEIKELYVYNNEMFWYGLIISGNKKMVQHKRIRDNGKIIIKEEKIKEEPSVELNFFCIRRDSGKGIFSYYRGSYQFGQFIKDLWGTYRTFVKNKKNAAKLERKLTKNQLNEQYSLYKKNKSSPLYTPETYKELVKRLEYVDEVRFSTYECDDEEDVAVSDILKSKYVKYKFVKDVPILEKTKDWLVKLRYKSKKVNDRHKVKYNGRIKGFDSYNNPLDFNFDSTMADHLDYDYDKIGDIDIENLINHEIIELIIARLEDAPLFEKTK